MHRRVDKPSLVADLDHLDLPEGSSLRSISLESENLGLTAKIDVCEWGSHGVEVIDYKKGSASRDIHGERVAKEADKIGSSTK